MLKKTQKIYTEYLKNNPIVKNVNSAKNANLTIQI